MSAQIWATFVIKMSLKQRSHWSVLHSKLLRFRIAKIFNEWANALCKTYQCELYFRVFKNCPIWSRWTLSSDKLRRMLKQNLLMMPRTKNLLSVPNAFSLIQSRQIDLSFYILSRSAFSVFLCISILVLEVHSVNILMLNVICLPIVSSWFPLLCVSRILYQSDALSLTFYALSSSFDISFYLLPMFWAHFLSLSKP